jgi:class 3 adenylate cyclase
MEPEVRYCVTADRVRIAYTVTGQGPPVLMCLDPIGSHVQLEWSHPVTGLWLRESIRHNTLIRFDARGCGLSDRVMGQTLDEFLLDIEAVVERTGFDRFALSARETMVPAAILFASRHPEQVTRMVLMEGFVRYNDFLSTPQAQALLAAAAADWTLATEAIGFAAYGSGREANRVHGEYIRACVGPEFFEFVRAGVAATWDVTEAARSVAAPTLVMKHAGIQYVTMEMTRDLVALIPNAQLAVIEGQWADNIEATVQRAMAFLNGVSEEAQRSPELPSGMTAILFADIADSTGLTERLGDDAFRAKARDLDAALRTVIREHTGMPIEGKLLGDGVLAVFTSARQAIEAALACGRSGDDAGLPLHLGLHAGDVIREENNVYGGAVNIASRISGLSAPGEVLVSETVRSLARTSAGVTFEDRGEQALKGVGESVRVWAVVEGETT